MLLSHRGGNDTLTNIRPRRILGFGIRLAIDVFAPSAKVVRLLDRLTD